MIPYIVKTVLCSGLLMAAYLLLLQKEKMHRFNRVYLLFSIFFSLLVPLITIEGETEVIPFVEPIYVMPPTDQATFAEMQVTTTTISSPPNWLHLLLLLYGMVTLVLLFRFVRNLGALLHRIKTAHTITYRGAKLVLISGVFTPHSFLRWIFVDRDAFEKEGIEEEILQHELTHVKQAHSLDVLFMESLLVIAWFNPFFYGFRKAICLNHEFLADAAVVKKTNRPAVYQQLLLTKLGTSRAAALSSSFQYSFIKKRLIMMTKRTSPQVGLLKQVTVAPLLVLLAFAFSTKRVVAQTTTPATVIQEKTQAQKNPQTKADSSKLHSTIWLQRSIGSTKEGASQGQLEEYEVLAEKNFPAGKTTKEHWEHFSKEEKAKMEGLFRQMSVEQQLTQRVFFTKPAGPLPKVVPSKQQIENFKNPTVYGLWINEKKVPNSDLNRYVNTDFSQVFVSKLYGAAKKGRSYTHQVDMMTNAYYENYVRETNASKESGIIIKWPAKTKK